MPTVLMTDYWLTPLDSAAAVVAMPLHAAPGATFIATRATWIAPSTIAIDFNSAVDPVSALDKSGYKLDPPGAIVGVSIDPGNPARVLLTVESNYPFGAAGRAYTVMISRARSIDGRLVNDGAGSVVGFSIDATSLDGVRVFPHPFSISRDVHVTFAGLIRGAHVEVVTTDGALIRRLNETEGEGGVDWDGRDFRGAVVPSGIYLYRATAVSADGTTIDSGFRKIAVVE
jgi:hypothetical protein